VQGERSRPDRRRQRRRGEQRGSVRRSLNARLRWIEAVRAAQVASRRLVAPERP
jgi:hypothetical protein